MAWHLSLSFSILSNTQILAPKQDNLLHRAVDTQTLTSTPCLQGLVKKLEHFLDTRPPHVSSVTGYKRLAAVITCHVSPGLLVTCLLISLSPVCGHELAVSELRTRVLTCVVPPGQCWPLAACLCDTWDAEWPEPASARPRDPGVVRAQQPIRGQHQGRLTNQRPGWADRSRDHQWHTAMASASTHPGENI